jgi:hypothetical protein
MLDPTAEEISFLRKLKLRDGKLALHGNLSLLNIDRLIPDYVACESTAEDSAVFTITEKGRELLQTVDKDEPNSKGG